MSKYEDLYGVNVEFLSMVSVLFGISYFAFTALWNMESLPCNKTIDPLFIETSESPIKNSLEVNTTSLPLPSLILRVPGFRETALQKS